MLVLAAALPPLVLFVAWAAHCLLPAACLLAACYSLPAAPCSLLAACCLLLPACYSLPAICCLLPAICCLLPAACCSLLAACCLLASWLLHVAGRRLLLLNGYWMSTHPTTLAHMSLRSFLLCSGLTPQPSHLSLHSRPCLPPPPVLRSQQPRPAKAPQLKPTPATSRRRCPRRWAWRRWAWRPWAWRLWV